MLKFINNIGDYFSSNYFDEDFTNKVLSKTGYASEDVKDFNKKISPIKDKYFRFKQLFIEGRLRVKDKIFESHQFHTLLLNALGYDGNHSQYNNLFHLSENEVIPVRHILYRGDQTHLMIMEMQALIKEDDTEPDGLFEQRYNVEDETQNNPPQKYHRTQWDRVFQVPAHLKISPVIINKAVSELFLFEPHLRPKYILLLAGNIIYLLEQEKWFRGSYLQFDLEELFSEATANRNANYYALFYFLLSKESLTPESNMVLLDQLDEDSHKSAYEVTKDLKEGIIHAVEALANEALYFQKNVLQEVFDETDDTFEHEIKDDCLNIIYRLLFVFYAESREDLDILPSNDPIYNKGYSLEMLRDLEQVPLYSEASLNGYFFHESLDKLFYLLSSGYREKENGQNKSFRVRHIDSPLFNNSKLHHLHKVKFRNKVWQDIICRLSLSKQQRNRARGRISYANLGINQLGSVYESLLAYRGFYAEQDYIEVHKANAASEGTYLVPRLRRDDFQENEILKDSTGHDIITKKGTFVYRLSGRDRQKSASYYTPEVLTRCTVKYTLKPILEKLDKGEMKATELLELKLLEPAMGAAAFHNEMINQLADAYITYRQKELNKRVAPDLFKEELQKVKAYIATNNTYGVDLNPTAIELGKLSLWLNVIHKDMETPFFSNRLSVGNAVVGAWLKVYKEKDLIEEDEIIKDARGREKRVPKKKEWWETAPRQLEFKPNKEYDKIKHGRKSDEIYHFLLPDKNMAPSAGIKMLKAEYDTESKGVTKWKKDFCEPLKKFEVEKLKKICDKIDELLAEFYRFQRTINTQTANKQEIFGVSGAGILNLKSYDEKEQLADQRNRHNAPYFKLKMVMDYWCSLWFWDLRDAKDLPNRQQYWQDIAAILELDLNSVDAIEAAKKKSPSIAAGIQPKLFYTAGEQLTLGEETDNATLFAEAVVEYANRKDLFDNNQRLAMISQLANKYFFFHPQLEFLDVFWERGGFDLIAGNPPWDQIEFDSEGLLIEIDPRIALRQDFEYNTNFILGNNGVLNAYYQNHIEAESVKSFVRSKNNYAYNDSSKSNLYKLILENCFILSNKNIGIIHDRGIYNDTNGYELRRVVYKKLKYLFRFNNELKLFQDVGNAKKFEISIFSSKDEVIGFESISNVFHPNTIDQSYTNSDNSIYGIRDDNDNWELRSNNKRIIRVDNLILKQIATYFDSNKDFTASILPYFHSTDLFNINIKLNQYPSKLKNSKSLYDKTQMLNEDSAVSSGIIIKMPGQYSKEEFVLNGPNFYVANPFFQTPNITARNHRDYSKINLREINDSFLPLSSYKLVDSSFIQIPNNYYHVHRRRAINTNERTLISCIEPPGIVHLRSCYSLHFNDQKEMLAFHAGTISIIYDFIVRSTGKEDLVYNVIQDLPLIKEVSSQLLKRVLILESLTKDYEELYNSIRVMFLDNDIFSLKHELLKDIGCLPQKWDANTPLRTDFERKIAVLEIDVLVCFAIGINLEELISIYLIEFPVLKKHDNLNFYNNEGMLYKAEELRGINNDSVIKIDVVEVYRNAWEHFEKIFKDNNIA